MHAEETIEVRPEDSFDAQKVERYLRDHLEGIGEGTLQVRQFPSGASNLTYLLRIGSWEAVLRRPPAGPLPPRAHDMQRESTLLQFLHPVFPLAPQPYLFCNDPHVMDVPFYIMERRHGLVVDTAFPAGVEPTPALCQALSRTVIGTLAQIHAVDWHAAGLGAQGHPTGFLERQVTSWIERYRRAQSEDIPQAATLMRWLAEHIPVSPPPTFIHNDFKLNNLLLDIHDVTHVTAVLDWEMATLGDPLFDLAVTLSYWWQSDDVPAVRTLISTVTTLPGFLTRDQCLELYSQISGRDLSSMHFYLPLAYFKLAAILQQIYVRWQRGQTHDERFAAFGTHVRTLLLYAAQLTTQHKNV